jgi:hypothetical protein
MLYVKVRDLRPLHAEDVSGRRPSLAALSDVQLLESVRRPRRGDPLRIDVRTGRVVDGNGRAYELIRRAASGTSPIGPDTEVPYEPYAPDDSAFWDI